MLKAERHSKILELVNEKSFMTVDEISTILSVSKMTIRRDVNELDSENKLIRVYGGAQKIDVKDKEYSTSEKIDKFKEEKEYIGERMNHLISDNDVIYLGAGTTILYSLSKINKKNLFIITNSLLAFNYLNEHTDYRLILTGGEFNSNTEEFIGDVAERAFDNLNIDIAFAATNGIYNNNITTSNALEGSIQRKAFEHSKEIYVVADSTKFNVSDFYTFYNVDQLTAIITDNKISQNNLKHYSNFSKIIYK